MAEAERSWRPKFATSDDDFSPIPWERLLREPPARDWMVERCFLRGTVGMISGDGKIGKSLICQQLATSAVLGVPWLGLTVKPGRALYMACEDDENELNHRQRAINRHLGVVMEDVLDAGLDLRDRVARDNALMFLKRPEWKMTRTSLMDKLVTVCRRDGVQYVIIDTATKTFRGNQNDEVQVDDFITELRRLAIAIQGLVLLTKHPSVTGRALGTGESGSVAWNNSVRSRLYMHESKNAGLALTGMASNYGRKLDAVPLRWERGVFERVEAPAPRDYSEPGGYD